jgi:transcriptional regulator with XRE-family HTH domain
MHETFGERLQRYRKKAGFTLEGLAAEVESTKGYIWELENKPNIRPSADLVYRIAKTFGTTVGVLMGEEEPDEALTTDLREEDRVFFRNYRELRPQTKKQLSEIMEVLKKESDEGS